MERFVCYFYSFKNKLCRVCCLYSTFSPIYSSYHGLPVHTFSIFIYLLPSIFLFKFLSQYQVPFRADLVKSTAANKQAQLSPPVLLDLVLRGSDHQNFVDIHLIARKFLLSRPSMLGPDLDAVQAIRAIDTILPAFFRGAAQSRQSRRGLQAEEVAVELCASAMNTTSAAAAAVDKDEKDNNSTCARNKDNAGSSTLTTTTTTTAPQQADDIATLIEVCTLGMASSVNLHDVAGASAQVKTALSEEMVSFIRKNIVPAKEMPVGYGDDKVFKKILQQQLDQFDKTDAQ